MKINIIYGSRVVAASCFLGITSLFRDYGWLLSCNRTGYMICGAQCKIKTQRPLFEKQIENTIKDSKILYTTVSFLLFSLSLWTS